MSQFYLYTTDPGDEVLAGKGPAVNVVEGAQQPAGFARGAAVLGLIGAVPNDRGLPKVPVRITFDELFTKYGGFDPDLGLETFAAAARPANLHAIGYSGNLPALGYGCSAREVVMVNPDLGLFTTSGSAGTSVPISVTRASGTSAYTLPAGTQFKEAAGNEFTVATLEDVVWTDAAPNSTQSVRVRQVSASDKPPATSIDDVDTLVTTLGAEAATITTVNSSGLVPFAVDIAELLVRYNEAMTAAKASADGRAVTIWTTDQTATTIVDAVADFVTVQRSRGYLCVAVHAGNVGLTEALAKSDGTDGFLQGTRFSATEAAAAAVVHPAVKRRFLPDAANLTAPKYLATTVPQVIAACRLAQERPEVNHARPHPVLVDYGIQALEIDVTPSTHFAAGIDTFDFDYDPDSGAVATTLFSGVAADGGYLADRRATDFLISRAVRVTREYHKNAATVSNQNAALDAIRGSFQQLLDQDRVISAFSVSGVWDGLNQQFKITIIATLQGNANVLSFFTNIGTGVTVEEFSA
jgi:hypothetical protein